MDYFEIIKKKEDKGQKRKLKSEERKHISGKGLCDSEFLIWGENGGPSKA